MLGIIYLILSVLIGYEISGILTGPKEISTDTNRIWLVLPASFGTGILVVTWAVYIISQCDGRIRQTSPLRKPDRAVGSSADPGIPAIQKEKESTAHEAGIHGQ